MSSWIKERVSQIQKANPNAVVGIVVDKSEIQEAANNKSADLHFISNLAQSKEFRQDLNMSQSYWFYNQETMRRTLLLQYSVKPDSKNPDKKDPARNALRSLGAKAAQEFQGKKSEDVTLLLSDKLPADELGVLANAFHLTNYEYSHKTAPQVEPEEDKKAREEADWDQRSRKHGKVISKVQIVNKDGDIS